MSTTEVVTAMWLRLLGPDADLSGSFYDAAADAVMASALRDLVAEAFDVDLSAHELRAASTVAGLSQLIDRRVAQQDIGEPRAVTAPVAFSQEGMLWHEHFAPGSFNMAPFVRRYRGVLDVAALTASLSDIVARHAPLRTTFELVGGRPVQRVHPAGPLIVPLSDLSGLDDDSQRQAIAAGVADALARPFELASAPLFQPRLYRLGVDDHVVVIRLHHLAFDDWAVDVFRRELSQLYQAHHEGTPAAVPTLATSFAEFCRRQRRRMAGPGGAEQLAWWRRQLAGAPLTAALPLGDPGRPAGSSYGAAVPLHHRLPTGAVSRLRAVAGRQRCTLFMALLAVFGVVAHACTGDEDLILSTVVANRNALDLEPLLGCFTKKLPLRLPVAGTSTFSEVMEASRRVLLGSLAHQDLAFEAIVQDALGARAAALGVTPDLSVVFQADTPHRERLVLAGLTVEPYAIGSGLAQPHFAASGASAGADDAAQVWGGGIYQGTFLILSVVEEPQEVSLVARGAFHRPSLERILARFDAVLAAAASAPASTVGELAALDVPGDSVGGGPHRVAPPAVSAIAGFAVDVARVGATLARHPSVASAVVHVEPGPHGTAELVAYLCPSSDRELPTLAALRDFYWARTPGYPWPSKVFGVDSAGAHPWLLPDTPGPDERHLCALWAEALGDGPVEGSANYWQRFSFVDVLSRAGTTGVSLTGQQVRRNRTVRTLAADIGSTRMVALTADV